MSPRPGNLSMLSEDTCLSIPAMAKLWPSASSMVVEALRLKSAGPAEVVMLSSISETSCSRTRLIRFSARTVGVNPSFTPYSFHSTPWLKALEMT